MPSHGGLLPQQPSVTLPTLFSSFRTATLLSSMPLLSSVALLYAVALLGSMFCVVALLCALVGYYISTGLSAGSSCSSLVSFQVLLPSMLRLCVF